MRKPLLLPALLLALSLAGSELRAQDPWVALIHEPTYTTWVDTASIVRTGSGRFSTWTVWSRTAPEPGSGDRIGSVAEYREYDCAAHRSRLRSIFLLDTAGQAVDAREGSSLPWEVPARESDREVLLDLVCVLAKNRRAPP